MRDAAASVTEAQVAAYERDGVVCLRGVLPSSWLQRMEAAVERALERAGAVDMTEMARSIEASGGEALVDASVDPRAERGHFYAGTDHWLSDPDFHAFAATSPLPALAATLMRSDKVNLYEDSLLVKEPGTVEPTAFHQDLAYFHVEGEQICSSWSPLDPVSQETGAVQYVRGSHLWRREFRPNLFVSTMPIPGTRGEEVPDIQARPADYELVQFDTEPGDVVVHHARTLHGAGGNHSNTLRRRAVSVRYCGADARYRIREGAPMKPHHHHVKDGDLLDLAACPVVWRSDDRD